MKPRIRTNYTAYCAISDNTETDLNVIALMQAFSIMLLIVLLYSSRPSGRQRRMVAYTTTIAGLLFKKYAIANSTKQDVSRPENKPSVEKTVVYCAAWRILNCRPNSNTKHGYDVPPLHTIVRRQLLSPHSTTPTPARPTRLHPYVRHARLKLFLWQAERHADILTTILARMSVSVSASWNASFDADTVTSNLRHCRNESQLTQTDPRDATRHALSRCKHRWTLSVINSQSN